MPLCIHETNRSSSQFFICKMNDQYPNGNRDMIDNSSKYLNSKLNANELYAYIYINCWKN